MGMRDHTSKKDQHRIQAARCMLVELGSVEQQTPKKPYGHQNAVCNQVLGTPEQF